MIENNVVLIQMEKLLRQAQQSPTEANLREQLTAIRALCDVILHTNETMPSPIVKVQSQNENQLVTPTSEKILESDANGDSIFDF